MSGRRHFGTVRKRPSGRWQAVYWYEGGLHSAGTFAAKADALARLSTIEADFRRGAWIDPSAGQVTLKKYANEWIMRRPDLAVRTKELYEDLLRIHILPSLGQTTIAGLTPSKVRGWNAQLAAKHPSTASKPQSTVELSWLVKFGHRETADHRGRDTFGDCLTRGRVEPHSRRDVLLVRPGSRRVFRGRPRD